MSLVAEGGEDEWLATGLISLDGIGNAGLKSAGVVDDACGIEYDSTEWSSVDPSSENTTLWANYTHDGFDANIEQEDYDPDNGVVASVDLPTGVGHETFASVSTTLTRNSSTGNSDIPVRFEYYHNVGTPNPIGSVSISIGYAGISVDPPTGSETAWDDHVTASPGDHMDPV